MSKRLDILKNSLLKKNALFDEKIGNHFATVKSANGQPMNDKRNGKAWFNRLDKQNNALRALQNSIKKTEEAIDREETKISNVEAQKLPAEIVELINDGAITQWRKYPNRFFVVGVEKARIVLFENGQVGHAYAKEIPNQEQFSIFRTVFNELAKKINEE